MTTTNYKNYTLNDLNNTPWFSNERQLFTDMLNKLPANDTSHVQAEHIHSTLTQPNNNNVIINIGTDSSAYMPLQPQGFLQVTAGGKVISSSGVGGGGILDTSSFAGIGDGTAFYYRINDRLYMKTANSVYPVEVTGVNAGGGSSGGGFGGELNHLLKMISDTSATTSRLWDDGTTISIFAGNSGDTIAMDCSGSISIAAGGTIDMTNNATDDADITISTSGSNSQIILRTTNSSNIVLDSNQELDLESDYIYLGHAFTGLIQGGASGITMNGDSTLALTANSIVNVSSPKGVNIISTGTGTVNFTSNTGTINIKALTSGNIDIETASGGGTLQCTGTMLIQTTGGDLSMHCPVGNTLNITKDDGAGHVGQFGMDANAVYITSQCGTGDLYILADGLADFHAGSYKLYNISIYADNTAAISGGLSAGMLYRDGSNPDHLCIVH